MSSGARVFRRIDVVAVALLLTVLLGADPVGRHVSVPTYAPPSRYGLMPSPEAGSLMTDAAVRASDTRSAGGGRSGG